MEIGHISQLHSVLAAGGAIVRKEFYPDRRESCCVCSLRGTVQRLIKRVAELERKQAGIEGKFAKIWGSGEKGKSS